jgi:hypothetical protein
MNPAILISTGRAAGSALKSVGSATLDTCRTAKEVAYDPVTGALETAVRTDIGDVIPSSLNTVINTAAVGPVQDLYDDIKDYSLADMVEEVFGGASDSVGVQHGRMSRPDGYNPNYRYPQHISLVNGTNDMLERQNLFTFMDGTLPGGVLIQGDRRLFDPDWEAKEPSSPYIQGQNPLDWMKVGRIDSNARHSDGPIYGPFSKFTPTFMWPWQTTDGARMTAAEFAEVPLESDWLGTKPIVEAAIGQKMDKVGGLPGYRFYGDAVLATPLIASVIVAFVSAPLWTPVVSAFASALGSAGASLGRGLAR